MRCFCGYVKRGEDTRATPEVCQQRAVAWLWPSPQRCCRCRWPPLSSAHPCPACARKGGDPRTHCRRRSPPELVIAPLRVPDLGRHTKALLSLPPDVIALRPSEWRDRHTSGPGLRGSAVSLWITVM